MPLNGYKSAVSELLLDFQWIEMSLRIVISGSYELLSKTAPAPIAFRPKPGAVARDALGRLIERYAEISPNENMQKRLRALLKERNYCAHQSFILSSDELQDSAFLERETRRMEALREQTRSIVLQLHSEIVAISEVLQVSVATIVAREAATLSEPSEPGDSGDAGDA